MKGLEKRGARGRAYQVFQYMVEAKQEGKVRLAHHNFNTIMLILGREGKMRLARSVFDSMAAHGCHAGVFTYSALMTGYAKHGLVKEAFEVFEAMKGAGVEANTVTFNILIHACAKTGIRIGKVGGRRYWCRNEMCVRWDMRGVLLSVFCKKHSHPLPHHHHHHPLN